MAVYVCIYVDQCLYECGDLLRHEALALMLEICFTLIII